MSDSVPNSELVVVEERRTGPLSVQDTMDALDQIRQLVAKAMKPGHDYGLIPGTNNKQVMLLPGAQKTAMYFNVTPEYDVKKTELPNGHCEIDVTCNLTSRANGRLMGQGVGSCSTMESKYRYRGGSRLCPACNKPTIKKSKYPPRNDPQGTPGFYCYSKLGGCGVEFAADDQTILSQSEERQENPDIADARNTVLKMAKKRALVDAALGLGCMAELFTQDIEPEEHHGEEPAAAPKKPPVTMGGKPLPTGDADPKARERELTIGEWREWIATNPIMPELNSRMPRLSQMRKSDPAWFDVCWKLTTNYATTQEWRYDRPSGVFITYDARAARLDEFAQ